MTDRKFNPGDRVLLVDGNVWGPRRMTERVVASVQKTGLFRLEGSDVLWRQNGSPAPSNYSRGRVEPYDEDVLSANRALHHRHEQRNKLNVLGDRLSRIRDDDEGARLWALLPDDIRNLIKEPKP